MNVVTFIGGPWDLHRRAMQDLPHMLYIPALEDPVGLFARESLTKWSADAEIPSLRVRSARYQRVKIWIPDLPPTWIYIYRSTE